MKLETDIKEIEVKIKNLREVYSIKDDQFKLLLSNKLCHNIVPLIAQRILRRKAEQLVKYKLVLSKRG